jgi:HEAT repeat protein
MGPGNMEKTLADISHSKESINTPDNSSLLISSQPLCSTGEISPGVLVQGEVGEIPHLQESITLLFAHEESTRIAAAQTLGILGDQQAIVPLFRACMDEHASVRDAAREALARISMRRRQRI